MSPEELEKELKVRATSEAGIVQVDIRITGRCRNSSRTVSYHARPAPQRVRNPHMLLGADMGPEHPVVACTESSSNVEPFVPGILSRHPRL